LARELIEPDVARPTVVVPEAELDFGVAAPFLQSLHAAMHSCKWWVIACSQLNIAPHLVAFPALLVDHDGSANRHGHTGTGSYRKCCHYTLPQIVNNS
jgi:hypothetical protein